MSGHNNNIYSVIKDDKNKTTYLIIRDTKFKNDDFEKEKNENLTIVFNFEDLSKKLTPSYASGIISKFHPNSLKIENSLVESSNDNFLNETEIEQFDVLYISDECYSMSPHLKDLFPVKAKTLILKKIKINSKKQLNNFLTFILSTNCENLFLEDIFIELLIKKDENDENFNVLDEYIGFENGKFYIKSDGVKKTLELKTLKLIDCPLFAITDDTFKEIKKYKEIKIDIDENSLLNPSIITRFRIDVGLSDFCFDLDSYKLNEEEKDDDIENIEYIINKIADDENNEYNKLIFKNFDITKYEYITGENLTYIDEENWILNSEEKERYKKFEDFDKDINKKINDNINKLSKVKSLVFDNCSNYFIQLILKFINSSKNDLDLLKLKKCGKEYFDIKDVLSLKIENLILFDTPLIIDSFPDDELKIENLAIKINTLQYYCNENNLNYDKTIENYIELINHQKLNQNLTLEMNALPILKKYLSSTKNKKGTSQNIIKGLENKAIILKNNNIRHHKLKPKSEKTEKSEEIIQEIDTDINYISFINENKVKTVILKDCTFDEFFENNIQSFSFINLINNNKNYKIDIKSLNEYIYKNQFDSYFNFFNHLMKTTTNSNHEIESSQPNQYNDMRKIILFKEHLTKLFKSINHEKFTLIFSDIKERKEFYCLLYFFEEFQKEENLADYTLNQEKKIKFFSHEKFKNLKQNLGLYFIQEQSELKTKDDIYTVFNYYYSSEDEIKMFGQYGKEKNEIEFGKYKFKVEYLDSREGNELKKIDPWEVLWN